MIYAAVDFGNTRGKLAFFEKGELVDFQSGLDVKKVNQALKKLKPQACIISSVTKETEELKELFGHIKNCIFLDKNTSIPIKNGYLSPDTLGYDRLAAAVGAKHYFPNSNVLIIDMGTAIKYDYVNAEGVFEGGMIGPGLQMRFKSLHTFTKKLPLLDANGFPELIGTTTSTCIRSGVVNGMLAEINGVIERYGEVSVIITGGDAPFFESKINYPTFAAPNLVLEGLNRILEYNVEKNKLIL